MKNQNETSVEASPEQQAQPGALGLATGSASEVIIAELTGLPIRKLNRERMLQTGDRLSNKFGQELWTVEAFHPKGVRVRQWPMGNLADYTWEALYGFYERVPAALQNIRDEARR